MLFSYLTSLALAAGLVHAVPTKRASGLVVSVTSKDATVQSIDDLVLTATVQNTGSADVKILNFATIFDANRLTRSFTVTKDGAEVPFTGIAMNVNLELVDDSAFTVIPAGDSVTVEHTNLAGIYDFEAAGTGSFTFEPVTIFQIIDETSFADAKIDQLVELDSTSVSVSVQVSDVAKRDIHEKRAVTTCSNASQNSFISASYTESKELARVSSTWVASNSGSALYTAYWGTNSASTIQSRFNAIANENSSSRTLSCTDTYGVCTGGVIAYTVIATTNIYYCSIFFNEVASTRLCSGTTVASRNVRGGTTLHEVTHAVSGTTDVTYGCAADQALSVANKLRNADNYNCFSTQVYQNTRC